VALHYGKPEQRNIDEATPEELARWMEEGHFPPGSMGSKIQSAIDFVRGGGSEVVITSPSRLIEALAGTAGTRIRRG
jgi:carbamate kinase